MRRWSMLVLVVSALTAGFAWWAGVSRSADTRVSAPTHRPVDVPAGDEGGRVAPKDAAETLAVAGTDSLRDTEVDGTVNLSPAGRPRIDRDLRRLFDYFLTRLGERGLPAIRADVSRHVSAQLSTRLSPEAVAEVMDQFDAYVALTRELAALAPTGDSRADFARLQALRRQRLGDAIAEAWYGDEERYLQNTLDRQAVMSDASLSASERAAALAALDATLDPAQRVARAPTDTMAVAVAQTEAFAAANTAPAERFAERERLYGHDAAQRLAALDREHAQWQARLATYNQRRQRLLADRALDDTARTQALQSLLAASFNGNERLRVEALARLDRLPH